MKLDLEFDPWLMTRPDKDAQTNELTFRLHNNADVSVNRTKREQNFTLFHLKKLENNLKKNENKRDLFKRFI